MTTSIIVIKEIYCLVDIILNNVYILYMRFFILIIILLSCPLDAFAQSTQETTLIQNYISAVNSNDDARILQAWTALSESPSAKKLMEDQYKKVAINFRIQEKKFDFQKRHANAINRGNRDRDSSDSNIYDGSANVTRSKNTLDNSEAVRKFNNLDRVRTQENSEKVKKSSNSQKVKEHPNQNRKSNSERVRGRSNTERIRDRVKRLK